MKRIGITALIFLTIQVTTFAQTQFNITWWQGFGSFPTFTQYSDNELLSLQEAENAFSYIQNEIGIEWRYSYAGCEKRAHAASLFLNEKNIKHYKIWNFDPSMLSLFNKQQRPTVKNKVGLSATISWRYHVAILVFVKDNNQIKPMVIDPSIDEKLITQQQWLDYQNAPNSYYIHLDPQWYNYETTNNVTYSCKDTTVPPKNVAYPFPPCMNGILTGDFYLNDGVSLTEMWIEEALTVNQLAMKIITDIIYTEPVSSDKKKAFTQLVENFDSLTNALNGSSLTDEIIPYQNLLQPYQSQFIMIRDSWKSKLDAVR